MNVSKIARYVNMNFKTTFITPSAIYKQIANADEIRRTNKLDYTSAK